MCLWIQSAVPLSAILLACLTGLLYAPIIRLHCTWVKCSAPSRKITLDQPICLEYSSGMIV